MKNFKKTLITLGLIFASLQASASAIDLSDWAVKEYIEANSTGLLSQTIVNGNMKSNITREEFCELTVNLYEKLTNEKIREPKTAPFEDCDNVAVSKAYYIGIVSGVSEGIFAPSDFVTRQQMSVMLLNTLAASEINVELAIDGLAVTDLSNFKDAKDVAPWAETAVITMINHGLISGNEFNEIMPASNTTREQAMSCVNRCYKAFASVSQDRYMLPLVETDGGMAKWSLVDDTIGYYVMVKDIYGDVVKETSVGVDVLNYSIDENVLGDGNYSVTVGSVMKTGDTVFSVPVDFVVGNNKTDTNNKKEEISKPSIDYSKEVVTSKAKEILAEAEKYLGIPYLYGGRTPAGFDCSGFVQYVYGNCGISLTRVSRDQYAKEGVKVSKAELMPGDLVFFGTGSTVSHVGIYAGGGQMIHSPSTGKSIMYTSINSDYYLSHYIGAKRVIE